MFCKILFFNILHISAETPGTPLIYHTNFYPSSYHHYIDTYFKKNKKKFRLLKNTGKLQLKALVR